MSSAFPDSAMEGWSGWYPGQAQDGGHEDPLVDAADSLGLHQEYEEAVRECCVRYGIDTRQLRVEAVCLGTANKREVYVVLLTVKADDAITALQLTYIAPTIERRVAATLRARWVGDYTHFAGVWTHWPAQVRVPEEIRGLLAGLQPTAPGMR